MAKLCSKCGRPEGVVAFATERSRGVLRQRPDCKECRKAYLKGYYTDRKGTYFRDYREKNRDRMNRKAVSCHKRSRHERYDAIQKIKEGSPCMDCGDSYPFYVMDFDHRDPSTKVADVSHMVKTYVPWWKVLEEIAKCDLVCVRCHRLRTYQGDSNYRTHHWVEARAALDATKEENPCFDCGGFFKACQMDFDHISGVKEASIADLLKQNRFDEIASEIAKCQLVCANCHRVRTQERHPGRAVQAPTRDRTLQMGMVA